MSKKILFFALTLLLAFPAFVSASGDEGARARRATEREMGDVDRAAERVGEALKDLAEEAGEAGEAAVDEARSKAKRFGHAVTAPLRWPGRAKRRIAKKWRKMRGKDLQEDESRFQGFVEMFCEPADAVADISPSDVAHGVWEFRLNKLIGTGTVASLGLNVVLGVALYKTYKSDPVQKRLRAFRQGLRNMVRGSAALESEKKTEAAA